MAKSTSADTNLAEIILNRQSVALARSQRLVQSWLPHKPSGTPAAASAGEEEEGDFEEGMDEISGVGYKRPSDDALDVGVLGGLKRRKIGSKEDTLLEQLLGKKAVAERRKAIEAKKERKDMVGMVKYKRAEKEMEGKKVEAKREVVEDDDEEEGRAAKFTSKKRKLVPASAVDQDGHAKAVDDPEDDGDMSADTGIAPTLRQKRKPGNYLDEVLSRHAAKSNRKKSKNKGRLKASEEGAAS